MSFTLLAVENVFLHVLNRRSSSPAPPSLLPSLWHGSSQACFNVSRDEDDKSLMAEKRLKNGLNYPLCRGYVSSHCAVFIAVMFTFISTRLKCVSLFPLTLTHRPLLIYIWPFSANRCYQAKKMFCLLSINEAHNLVKALLVRVHRLYCVFSFLYTVFHQIQTESYPQNCTKRGRQRERRTLGHMMVPDQLVLSMWGKGFELYSRFYREPTEISW